MFLYAPSEVAKYRTKIASKPKKTEYPYKHFQSPKVK